MKVAPVYAELESRDTLDQLLVHTGQHYNVELKDVFFGELPLPQPHHQLEVGSGSHGRQTAAALVGIEEILVAVRPQLVLVPGDVNSTLAGALAAAKLEIPICHLEAGLRSFDPSMPEEHNRRLTDHLASLLLTPSEDADRNLAREGIPAEQVACIGNTMIDTLFASLDSALALREWERLGLQERGYVLVTLHRPALVDDPARLAEAVAGLNAIAERLPVVFPVHPRTAARLAQTDLPTAPGLHLVPPLAYRPFLSLEARAAAVVTDSGGVQEETTALAVPCFTLRANTERPVTLTQGTNTLLGFAPERLAEVPDLIATAPSGGPPPLWDGHAAVRAADAIERFLA